MTRPLFLSAFVVLFAACDASNPDPIVVTSGVLVANQGAFGADDGGLTVYDPATDRAHEVYGGLYVQSVAVHADRLYLASLARVDVLDTEAFARVEQYTVANPRYVAFDGDRAFVTSLFDQGFSDGGLVTLDLVDGTVGDRASVGGNPDGVALVGDRLYVANFDFGASRTITVLNVDTFEEIERVDVGCDGPRFLFVDAQDEVIVVCTGATTFDTEGNVTSQTNGAIVVLGGESEVARVDLPTPLGTASLGQDAHYAPEAGLVVAAYSDGRTLYRFDTDRNALDGTLDVGGDPINAVAFDGVGDALYVGRLDPDASFTAEGTVTIHNADGTQTGRFGVGVVPSHIAFLRAND